MVCVLVVATATTTQFHEHGASVWAKGMNPHLPTSGQMWATGPVIGRCEIPTLSLEQREREGRAILEFYCDERVRHPPDVDHRPVAINFHSLWENRSRDEYSSKAR